MYSRPGVLELLPALPKAWSAKGSVTGIGARGGFHARLLLAGRQGDHGDGPERRGNGDGTPRRQRPPRRSPSSRGRP
ncbi:glycoside hydrolase family 95-like protein [Streptomyces sp. L7]